MAIKLMAVKLKYTFTYFSSFFFKNLKSATYRV